MDRERQQNLRVEGEPSKRYGISYGGDTLGSWDSAKEALEHLRKHREVIRPVTDPKKKWDYGFNDRRREITLEELRRAAKSEA